MDEDRDCGGGPMSEPEEKEGAEEGALGTAQGRCRYTSGKAQSLVEHIGP